MKKFILLILLLLSCSFSFAQTEKPKKEIFISIKSSYYRNATMCIEGFMKQANISDFFIDKKVDTIESKNFQFKNKTIDQAISLLSRYYNVEFKFSEKKDSVEVMPR